MNVTSIVQISETLAIQQYLPHALPGGDVKPALIVAE